MCCFVCVIWVYGGLMFDPNVPQRSLCDKRCLDIDLKASQKLPRRESPLTQQPVIPWRWCSESPWTEATCLLWVCCLLFRRWKQIKQKQLTTSCFLCVWGFSWMHDSQVFRHLDTVYPFIISQWFSAAIFFWQDMINVGSSTAETADSRTHGVAVASNDGIYF